MRLLTCVPSVQTISRSAHPTSQQDRHATPSQAWGKSANSMTSNRSPRERSGSLAPQMQLLLQTQTYCQEKIMKLFSANIEDLRTLYIDNLQKALDMEQKITAA